MGPLSSRIHLTKSNTKQKRFRRAASLFLKSYFNLNKMLFFGIVFVLYFSNCQKNLVFGKQQFVKGKGGGSHYVDIIIGGGYLMIVLDYKVGRRVQKCRKK